MKILVHSPPILKVIAGGLAAILLVVLVAAQSIWTMRQHEIESDRQSMSAQATILAEQTSRTIQAVELVLEAVAHDAGEGQKLADEATHRALAARVVGLPQLEAIGLFDEGGTLVASSRWYPPPPLNIADDRYFKERKTWGRSHIQIGSPIASAGTGALALPVMHAGGPAHGGFEGMVSALIPARYFEELYASTQPSPGMAISLWTLEGKLIAHYPPLPGSVSTTHPLHGLVPGTGVDVIEDGFMLPGARMKNIRRLASSPIVVVVSKSMDEVLADWWRDTFNVLAVASGGVLAIVLAMAALIRQFRAYEARSAAQAAEAVAIRARKDAEAALAEVRRMETVGRLTAGVAHDFNNLLMTISGSLDLLAPRHGDRDASAYLLSTMRQAVDRGAQLIRQLLAYARQQKLAEAPLDVNAVLLDSESLLASSVGPSWRIVAECAPDLPPVLADAGQFQDMLINLVLNARDAMPEGGEIRLATRFSPNGAGALGHGRMPDEPAPGPCVEILVADQGAGMDAETLAPAMEPFFTTKPPGRGSGLGLSQVQGTIHQSGGAIRIESAPGQGTRVRLYLPVAKEAGRGEAGRGEAGRGEAGRGEAGRGEAGRGEAGPGVTLARTPAMSAPQTQPVLPTGLRVLVVEDEAPVRAMLVGMLLDAGCAVIEAGDGAEGLARVAEQLPDLVLADLAMPGMDGAEMARRLRAGEAGPCPPVVFMTGYPDAERIRGEAFVLRKPFRINAVLSIIREALEAELTGANGQH